MSLRLAGERIASEMMGGGTIYALSSGVGPSGVAVIRLSGPGTRGAVEVLTGTSVPAPRRLMRRTIHGADGEMLDRGLVAWFPEPGSFTGEDVAEIHSHGGRAVVAGVLEALGLLGDLRLAEPGEFTRRAFENGKLDLTAAEGLADLVAARTAAQRRQAVRQMEGALAGLYEGWRGRLLRCLGLVEASIDFSEEDLPAGMVEEALEIAGGVVGEIRRHLDDRRRGEQMRDGFRVAIVGPPNVGKSSLLNWFAGRDVAIVSARAGTTRDVVEVQLDLGGLPVTLCDTAGLRVATGDIEAEGVRRALAEAGRAGLVITVASPDVGDGEVAPEVWGAEAIAVWNKVDLVGESALKPNRLWVSARTGEGLEELLTLVENRVRESYGDWEEPVVTRARHREALESCVGALGRVGTADGTELVGEDVRHAVACIGRVTGRVDVEAMLDGIFREFCVGK